MRETVGEEISIHALREEGDPPVVAVIMSASYFYPRPPRGGRRFGVSNLCYARDFYPRPPRGGRRGGSYLCLG